MILAEPIFLSLQWEWPNTWKPSIFIRFYGCNLCCKRCDSLYAVNSPEWIINIDLKEICSQIKWLKCKHIIFTWWEPTLFYEDIEAIQNELGDGYTYEIETNGSNPIRNNFNQINISPKLSNSWNKPYPLKVFDEMSIFVPHLLNICFKFVAKWKDDFDEILQYIKDNNLRQEWIYIMPEWVDKESQVNKEVLQFCLDNNFRYCQRMHILLFWNKKWV